MVGEKEGESELESVFNPFSMSAGPQSSFRTKTETSRRLGGDRDRFVNKGIKGPQSIAIKSRADKQNETDRRFQPLVSDASNPLFFCSSSRFGTESGTSSAHITHGPPKVLGPHIHWTCCEKEQRGREMAEKV